jgi:hypothetical protein
LGTPLDGPFRMRRTAVRIVTTLTLVAFAPAPAHAYSVLAHEALLDAVWAESVEPFIEQRFPGTSAEDMARARAYAYGGSLIQDLGYYPFGSRLFSNLVHYVRSGEFVGALVREARDVDELAFALGALAHYTGDTVGHSVAVNRVVPLMYPKLAREHGNEVLYAHAKTRHVMVEFSFDVLHVARGTFTSDAYQQLVGFDVAVPLLERAFRAIYGLELKDLFGDVDLAIGSYRRAASGIIPDITRIAWREKRDEILAASPTLTERDVVYTLTPQQYDQMFGTRYRKPGILARVVVALFKVVPKFGPFRSLAFEPLSPEAEQLFLASFEQARATYREALGGAAGGTFSLRDADLDTGRPPVHGANPLADDTFGELLERLEERQFADVPPALATAISAHYARAEPTTKNERKARRRLAALTAAQ